MEIARVRALARREARFLRRVFTPAEIRYCAGKRKAWQHYAVRFAAKEAVWKALGMGAIALREIEVGRSGDGRPFVLLRGRPAPWVQLSLSHSDDYAAAVALCLK